MNEKLLVGTRAFIVLENLHLRDIMTGKLVELDKLTFVEVIVCDRFDQTTSSYVSDRVFTHYKVAPTSNEEAKKITDKKGDWDQPFRYEGPIACSLRQLLEIINDEFKLLETLYSRMGALVARYLY